MKKIVFDLNNFTIYKTYAFICESLVGEVEIKYKYYLKLKVHYPSDIFFFIFTIKIYDAHISLNGKYVRLTVCKNYT